MNIIARQCRAQLLSAVMVGAAMVGCIPPDNYKSPRPQSFPRTGVWKLTGNDITSTVWKADVVIVTINGIEFIGYFDWYSATAVEYRGREHFTGRFDRGTKRVLFKGYRLENAVNLALGEYWASVKNDGDVLYDGKWGGGGGVPGSWAAVWSVDVGGECTACERKSATERARKSYNFNGHQYQLFENSKTWTESKKHCESLGGYLVTINNQAEQTFVKSLISERQKNFYWIGGYCGADRIFHWVTGEPMTYTNWVPGEPNNHQEIQDKMVIYRLSNPRTSSEPYQWDDVANNGLIAGEPFFSTGNFGYICEWGDIAEETRKKAEEEKQRIEKLSSYFTDSRNGQKYRAVKIGEKTWMAENLNYETGNSWCYGDDNSNCEKYGRLYDWNTAKTSCPAGWHLPVKGEWKELESALGGGNAGIAIKSTSGWDGNGNGTDSYGFSALPGGHRNPDGTFDNDGKFGSWWTATVDGSGTAYIRYMNSNSNVGDDYHVKSYGFSVRCVEDASFEKTSSYFTDSSGGNSAAAPPDYSGTYYIVSKNGTSFHTSGANTDNGTNIVLWNGYNSNSPQAQWSFELQNDGTYIITNVKSGKVIDVPQSSKTSGEELIIYSRHGDANQRWRVMRNADDYVSIISVSSGLAINIPNYSDQNWTKVIQYDYHGGKEQQFRLVPVN